MFRLDPRLRLRHPIEVTPRWEGGEPVLLEAIDLSTTGTACRGPLHLPLRTQVGVRLEVTGRAPGPGVDCLALACEAVVVNAERIGRSRTEWRTGLYFLDLPGEQREALRRFIYETLKRQQEAAMSEQGKSGPVGVAVAMGLAAALALPSAAMAYTVITRDGHRIEAKARPDVRGESAYLRLAPNGQLAVIAQDQVDWPETEKANPAPTRIAIPADAKLAVQEPEAVPVRIKGTAGRRAEPPATDPQADPNAVLPGKPAGPPKETVAQEAVVKLQQEYAFLLAQRDQLNGSKTSHERELATLESTDAAQAGLDNATTRRIRALKEQIGGESEQIQRLDVRMNDIRIEVVGLGGTID